ncbi:MAG: class I SAM-dependent methyltransferase [Anaerolineales bacterium]|nr:class I SAM-dependent methyltransferase [Anaerolineales bacterium]
MTIDQVFNAAIEYYDDWMRKALPNYAEIFRTAQELIPFDTAKSLEVLDLGAGTGLFSKHVLEKYPDAHFLLYDLADKMLEVARERFRGHPKQFEFIVGDYRALQVPHDYDLVISSLSIHHLAHGEKQDLFRKIFSALRQPGVFINIDQIRGETDYLRKLYWDHWLNQVRRQEPSEKKIQESIDRRTAYDRDAALDDQLRWLGDAGFSNVDCVYKNYFVGVFLAMRE